jgi:nitrogenase molybdenum-iron protein alpha/beta subunit
MGGSKTGKEWYKDLSAGYMEGNIDEIMRRARERKGLEDSNTLSVCDQCALATAIGILTGITGVENVMVVHGPTGCAQLQGSTAGTRFVTTTSREDLQKTSYYVPYFVPGFMETFPNPKNSSL